MSKTFFAKLLLLLLCIISLWFISSAVTRRNLSQSINDASKDKELLIAKLAAKALEDKFSLTAVKIQTLSRLPEIKEGDKSECEEILKSLTQGSDETLLRADEKGAVNCSSNSELFDPDAVKLNPKLSEFYKDPIPSGALVKSFITDISSEPAFLILYPISDNEGDFNGILGAVLPYDKLFNKYLEAINTNKGGSVSIQDQEGLIIYHQSKAFAGKNFWSEEIQNTITQREALNTAIKEVASGNKKDTFLNHKEGDKELITVIASSEIFPNTRLLVVSSIPSDGIEKSVMNLNVGTGLNLLAILMAAVTILIIISFVMYVRKMNEAI
ncbi:hypothetical protein A2716_01070 [candidate division WWE3 bacterium RIFCSPHIGHO2_01_FULL_40_23]|uniref:Cache domain-containing protein n=1 Tax=candidate division WWE3 bacterium RIFCSPLOWO2_01_FULL_41_18 TaxID=1802625 RepID=A0A1F4VEJ4_UNCKA|nr:MAG: hypothetical protein A2716_01070 [candidate division WWE3 bacterium RIFCSPHIGHO2_01_FULL_40_23]OGC55579.1 MAG: hypothetical protein A3A78_01340 [candidate division WWE3 bacterium RIFCSPLOWO2_01_FULL_41_18]